MKISKLLIVVIATVLLATGCTTQSVSPISDTEAANASSLDLFMCRYDNAKKLAGIDGYRVTMSDIKTGQIDAEAEASVYDAPFKESGGWNSTASEQETLPDDVETTKVRIKSVDLGNPSAARIVVKTSDDYVVRSVVVYRHNYNYQAPKSSVTALHVAYCWTAGDSSLVTTTADKHYGFGLLNVQTDSEIEIADNASLSVPETATIKVLVAKKGG